ncbi:MAG TPA: hypothetical protein P5567_12445 [Kiritimatiellia bacterium]|nr:hypothetical protein [Kiritimatiellia bacterium]HRZ13251.1 hypothetical protein [Kiritimatiellia bacterium]HSA18700.1 hypothetical protein [Kiritimatiellia bacterium]
MNEPVSSPSRRALDALPYLALAAYIVMTFVLIPRHELWRDEAADWLYTRWGPSLAAVLHDLGYQTDPGGWHTALYFLLKVFPSPLAMQVFHSLMAIAGVFLFIRFGPFTRLEKILYPFGFLVFYEYNIVARNYVPILLFLCLAATLYAQRFRRPWLYMLPLALMAQTHMYGGLFAGTLALLYVIELAAAHRTRWREYTPFLAPLFALGLVFLVSLYQLIPFAEVRAVLSGGGEIDYFQTARGVLLRLAAPVVKPQFYFWPANTVSDQHSTLLALLGLAGLLYLVHAKPVPLGYFLVTGGIIAYLLVFRGSNMRFIGMLWLLLVFTQWIGRYYPAPGRWADSRWMKRYPLLRAAIFSAFLALQAIGTVTAFRMDFQHPFSGGRETAQFLNAHLKSTNVLVGTVLSYATQSIQPYMRPEFPPFYCIEQERFYQGLICDAQWYENDKKVPPVEAIQRLIRKADSGTYDQVLLITLMPLQAPGVRVIGPFPLDRRVLCGDESFFVHEIDVDTLRAQLEANR